MGNSKSGGIKNEYNKLMSKNSNINVLYKKIKEYGDRQITIMLNSGHLDANKICDKLGIISIKVKQDPFIDEETIDGINSLFGFENEDGDLSDKKTEICENIKVFYTKKAEMITEIETKNELCESINQEFDDIIKNKKFALKDYGDIAMLYKTYNMYLDELNKVYSDKINIIQYIINAKNMNELNSINKTIVNHKTNYASFCSKANTSIKLHSLEE